MKNVLIQSIIYLSSTRSSILYCIFYYYCFYQQTFTIILCVYFFCLAHELGGFTCSFNAGHCCRYCLIHHRDMKHVYQESQTLIRTVKSHDMQVKQVQNVNSDRSMYGINEQSILSSLSSFHPITSLPPDIMHDILEGIMPKLSSCLLHTIVSVRLCTASELCQRINKFTYGTNDRRNRPVIFKEKDIFGKRIAGND